jgi:hypothetical protein
METMIPTTEATIYLFISRRLSASLGAHGRQNHQLSGSGVRLCAPGHDDFTAALDVFILQTLQISFLSIPFPSLDQPATYFDWAGHGFRPRRSRLSYMLVTCSSAEANGASGIPFLYVCGTYRVFLSYPLVRLFYIATEMYSSIFFFAFYFFNDPCTSVLHTITRTHIRTPLPKHVFSRKATVQYTKLPVHCTKIQT